MIIITIKSNGNDDNKNSNDNNHNKTVMIIITTPTAVTTARTLIKALPMSTFTLITVGFDSSVPPVPSAK